MAWMKQFEERNKTKKQPQHSLTYDCRITKANTQQNCLGRDNKQTWVKPGAALQTPEPLGKCVSMWVTPFFPWLYGAAKPKRFKMLPIVIKFIIL